jgi:hypothetical protein
MSKSCSPSARWWWTSSVTFKSDALGDLKIDWSKVKELQTSVEVAVIRKGVKLSRKETPAVPQGTLAQPVFS